MASAFLANRVRVATATSGVGTVTLGAKTSNKYATFAEGGITDAQVVTYTIEDGNDWEIGRGTYTASGTTLARDTVLISSVAGVVGTAKLNLSGAAEVFITAAKEDLDVNDFTEDTAPDDTADFHWTYDASAGLKKKTKPTNHKRTGGLQLLTSGTVTNAATLDIVLTAYTAYRALKFVLTSFVPVDDDVELWMRVSTNAGVSYDAGVSDYSWANSRARDGSVTAANEVDAADDQITLTGGSTASQGVSNVAGEGGVYAEITIADHTAVAFLQVRFESVHMTADSQTFHAPGGGHREAAQDTDAVQFRFETGNIASGIWAVYGYA